MVFFISLRFAGLIPQRSATKTILSRFFTSSFEVATAFGACAEGKKISHARRTCY
jgi:hypothetical protein